MNLLEATSRVELLERELQCVRGLLEEIESRHSGFRRSANQIADSHENRKLSRRQVVTVLRDFLRQSESLHGLLRGTIVRVNGALEVGGRR